MDRLPDGPRARKKNAARAGPVPPSAEPITAAGRTPGAGYLPLSIPLLALFATAFIVRLGVSAELGQTALFRNAQLDSREYLSWAQRIAAGDFTWPVPPAHGPGYPFLLGALLAMFNGSVPAVRLVQAALGAVTCLLAARLSGKLFGKNAELATGLSLAFYGPLVLTDVSILSEGLLLFFLCSAFLILSRG
ncbi:MAG: glycosyltransferase family 39 protein, partial [Acidobacteriota bacterium]